MELTPAQLGAARARGCVLTPATEDQVRRLSMQRRIFLVDGLPFVAARDGFFETHGTLAVLIEGHQPAAPEEPSTETSMAPKQEHAVQGDAGPPPAPARPDAEADAERDRNVSDAARLPRRGAPRPGPAPAAAVDPAPTGAAVTEASEAEEMLAGVAAAQGGGARARVAGRWRAGQPPTPRWTVAGKLRRGRLK